MPNIFVVPRFPDGKNRAFTVSYDDAPRQDVRLISLMRQYGVRGTFNINTVNMYDPDMTPFLNAEDLKEVYLDHGMEVACHAYHHPMLAQLPRATALNEVLTDRAGLEKICGMPVTGMAYPFGNYSDEVIGLLQDAGISYSRTATSTHLFRIPENWLAWNPTCFHGDDEMESLTERFLEKDPPDNRYPLLYYVWGHSYELDDWAGAWERMERLFSAIGSRDDIWNATNIEIYRYMKAYFSLEFSVECRLVRNPSACPVWMSAQGKTICVQPGQTLDLSEQLTDVKFW